MRYAFFPGCVLKGFAAEAYGATMEVGARLGMELIEMPGWSCCGATNIQNEDEVTALILNARNLALAEQTGLPLLMVCSTCAFMLLYARQILDGDGRREEINRYLKAGGMEYRGRARVTQLLWELDRKPEMIRNNIRRRLSGLKVAGFYGCHTVRPPEVMDHEDAQNPGSLENVIRELGAEPVPYAGRLRCCGFHALFTAKDDVERAAGLLLKEAAEAGAHCIVTPCPLCQMQLDLFKPGDATAPRIPTLHLAQLVGLALELPESKLGLGHHMVRFQQADFL